MKKKIAAIACVLALILAIPAAAAGGNGQNTAGGQSTVSGQNTENGQSAGNGAEVRTGASEGQVRVRGQALQARQNNLQIRLMNTENYSLRLECRQCIQEIKAGKRDLTEEQLLQLQDLQTQLQEQYDLLAATQGEVHELMLNFRADRLNQDYDAMSSDLEAIMAVQESRLAIKEEIGSLLQQILDVMG